MTTDRGFRWRCGECSRSYGITEVRYTCPFCGDLGLLDGEFDYARLKAARPGTQPGTQPGIDVERAGLWRYAPLLPASQPPCGSVAGGTPLAESTCLAGRAGVRRLWIKDEGRNPSGSLKDRASWLVVARALESGCTAVCTASSGNAGVALAAAAAAAAPGRLEVIVFVPPGTPPAKLAQLWAYGARVVCAQGGYDMAVTASRLAAEAHGWYCRNTAFNPFTTQGKKTVALEIVEQLGFRAPDAIVMPVGDGNIITGVHRGLRDAQELGWLDRLPRLVAVQSAAANPVERAWARGERDVTPAAASSLADSINVGAPADGRRALRALADTGGGAFAVPDDELGQATGILAAASGVFAEPAAATVLGGLRAAIGAGVVGAEDEVVLIVTGSGLKDPRQASRAATTPLLLEAGLNGRELAAAVRRLA